jgi:hypothetical protein
MSKEDKNPKEESRLKKRPEMYLEEEPAETAREKKTIISQNRKMLLHIKPRKKHPYTTTNDNTTQKSPLGLFLHPFHLNLAATFRVK